MASTLLFLANFWQHCFFKKVALKKKPNFRSLLPCKINLAKKIEKKSPQKIRPDIFKMSCNIIRGLNLCKVHKKSGHQMFVFQCCMFRPAFGCCSVKTLVKKRKKMKYLAKNVFFELHPNAGQGITLLAAQPV